MRLSIKNSLIVKRILLTTFLALVLGGLAFLFIKTSAVDPVDVSLWPTKITKENLKVGIQVNSDAFGSMQNLNLISLSAHIDTSEDNVLNNNASISGILTTIGGAYDFNTMLYTVLPDNMPGYMMTNGDMLTPGTKYYLKICATVLQSNPNGGYSTTTECSNIKSFTTYYPDGTDESFEEVEASVDGNTITIRSNLVVSSNYITDVKVRLDGQTGVQSIVEIDQPVGIEMPTIEAVFNNVPDGSYTYQICYKLAGSSSNECRNFNTQQLMVAMSSQQTNNNSGSGSSSAPQRRRYAVVLPDGTVVKSTNKTDIERALQEFNNQNQDSNGNAQHTTGAQTKSVAIATIPNVQILTTEDYAILEGRYIKLNCNPFYYFTYGEDPNNMNIQTPLKQIISSDNIGSVTARISGLRPNTLYYYQFILLGCDNKSSTSNIASFKTKKQNIIAPVYTDNTSNAVSQNETVTQAKTEPARYEIEINANKAEYSPGDEITYSIKIVKAKVDENIRHSQVEFILPEKFKFLGTTKGFYDQSTNSIRIGALKEGENIIYVRVKAKKTPFGDAISAVKIIDTYEDGSTKIAYKQNLVKLANQKLDPQKPVVVLDSPLIQIVNILAIILLLLAISYLVKRIFFEK